MNRLLRLLPLVLLACGEPAGAVQAPDGRETAEVAGSPDGSWLDGATPDLDGGRVDEPGRPTDTVETVDGTGLPDLHDDLPPVPDLPADTDDAETVLPHAALGEPCNADGDCLEGFCQETSFGFLCVPHCSPGCYDGWSCVGEGNESRCIPVMPPHCQPCTASTCPPAWCRTLGEEGSYCLKPCGGVHQCPDGSQCQTDEQSLTTLCRPAIESCLCHPGQVGELLSCQIANEFGSCKGIALCDAESGLLPCEGPEPAPEMCDGQDNDCDGLIDEDFPGKNMPCDSDDEDLCTKGKWLCGPDGTGLICAGDSPLTELCDDLDNDCDGLVDEDFPNKGKPCGSSPLCGTGTFVCSPLGLKTICGGVWPQKEKCDGKDNDCDGLVDEGFLDSDGDGVADCVE